MSTAARVVNEALLLIAPLAEKSLEPEKFVAGSAPPFDPNFDAASEDKACKELGAAGLAARVMVDFSHGNSRKDYKRQMEAARDVAAQLAGGEDRVFGVMVESHLKEGRQDLVPGKPLEYGKSITDACLGWEDSVAVLDLLAQAVRDRRLALLGKE
jgi:3-deoxy-7-phosphoheptulonate synthase